MDGMRALAALAVLVHHVGLSTEPPGTTPGVFGSLARGLNAGVAVFFLISGFLLYRPFVAARRLGAPATRATTFWRRRALRILPGYWVAVTVLAIYPGLVGVWSAHSWRFYLFTQDYFPRTSSQGIPVAWSLDIEVVFYAALPLVAWLAGRFGRRHGGWLLAEVVPVAIIGLASLAYFLMVTAHSGRAAAAPMIFRVPADVDWLALGMLLAVLSVWQQSRGATPRPTWIGPLAWVLAAVIFVATFHHVAALRNEHVAQAVIATLLILPATGLVAPSRVLGHLLANRVARWLGLISFGIYLYHGSVLRWLSAEGIAAHADAGSFAVLTACTVALAVALGSLSYWIVERPALRLRYAQPAALLSSGLRARAVAMPAAGAGGDAPAPVQLEAGP